MTKLLGTYSYNKMLPFRIQDNIHQVLSNDNLMTVFVDEDIKLQKNSAISLDQIRSTKKPVILIDGNNNEVIGTVRYIRNGKVHNCKIKLVEQNLSND